MRSTFFLALTLGAVACGNAASSDDINANWGGFTLDVEQPLFGPAHRDAFVSAGESAAPQAIADSTTPAPAVDREWAVWSAWGHYLPDREDSAVLNWSGTLSVDTGQMTLLRTLAFDRNDHVVPPPDERTVQFVSHTRPHFDGVVTRVVSPAAGPLVTLATSTLTQALALGETPLRADVALAEGVHAVMLSIPLSTENPCAHAIMTARWHSAAQRARGIDGRFVGRVLTPEGRLVGHWRGITGTRRDGTHAVYGKLIDVDGRALGRLRGTLDGDAVHLEIHGTDDATTGVTDLALVRVDASRAAAVSVPSLSACLAP